ncbi:redox-regulated ATPase YchF [Candidatus Woesearchaeota archaeon]|nr:redox-regulated ATPase YchF [Candidatus Woesearchaeota archaeon]
MLVGIVGKPSTGKSTFFKATTLAEVEIANYPFTTIKPNRGAGHAKVKCVDKEFNVQCNPRVGYCLNHNRFVPVELLDVAGLVEGAHQGAGLGNQFLDDLNQADVLIHVIDVAGSTNAKGESVDPGNYNPSNDVRFLEKELDMWYLRILKKGWEKFARQTVQEQAQIDKALTKQLSGLGVTEEMANEMRKKLNLNEKPTEWDDATLLRLATEFRKRTKPMIIACNKIDVPGAAENFARLENEFPDRMLVACSAESELALREAAKHGLIEYIPGESDFKIINEPKLNERQKKALEFIRENVLRKFGSTGVQEVLDRAVFGLLGYVAIFPGGVGKLQDKDGRYLPDCYLLKRNSTALDFAFRLHTDIGKGFIKAIDVKTKKAVGKEHILNHRDVIEIVTSK